jgi:hypothetical protein
LRMVKTSRVLALAAVAALAVPGVSLAAAHGMAQPSSPRLAAAGQHKLMPGQLKWVRAIMAKASAKALHSTASPGVKLGNFAQCPKLPAGDVPSKFICGLIHITGGLLDLGAAHQQINRNITISFAQGTDSKGNVLFVPGTLKSAPMPVAGGIFETPVASKFTATDKNLQLHVQPVGVAQAPDPTGQTTLIVSQRVKAINPRFGKNCSIGTKADPIVLDPTFGTTNPPQPAKPESGHIKATEHKGKEIVVIGTVVDNAFAAPAATRCGPPGATDPTGALNRVVNAVAALPAAAGLNNAVFKVTVEAINYSDI